MTALIKDQNSDVPSSTGRQAVCGQRVLPIRIARIAILGRQAVLPNTILDITALLSDEHMYVRRIAADLLVCKDYTYICTLLKVPFITSLYNNLLERSFEEQESWYFEKKKNNSYVNMPDSIREFSIDIQQNELRELINKARPADHPSISGEESSSVN